MKRKIIKAAKTVLPAAGALGIKSLVPLKTYETANTEIVEVEQGNSEEKNEQEKKFQDIREVEELMNSEDD